MSGRSISLWKTGDAQGAELLAQRDGGSLHDTPELIRGLRPSLDRRPAGHAQHVDRLHSAVLTLGSADGLSREDRPRGRFGIGRVRRAAPPAPPAIRSVDLDHLHVLRSEVPAQPGPVAAGSFDPDPLDRPEATQPGQESAIADRRRRELRRPEKAAGLAHRRGRMDLLVGIDPAEDRALTKCFARSHRCPRSQIARTGWVRRTGQ